jgi:hypothetical protein
MDHKYIGGSGPFRDDISSFDGSESSLLHYGQEFDCFETAASTRVLLRPQSTKELTNDTSISVLPAALSHFSIASYLTKHMIISVRSVYQRRLSTVFQPFTSTRQGDKVSHSVCHCDDRGRDQTFQLISIYGFHLCSSNCRY